MYKKIAVIFLACIILITCITATPAHAARVSMSAPVGATVSVEGTQFIVKWKNPADVVQLAQSAYKNYDGFVSFIVDWRVNNGPWHYDYEVPGEQDFLVYYSSMPYNFFGNLCDASGSISVPQTTIDKVLVGVPYKSPITEWLKKNNVEFRVRYLYNYTDRNSWEPVNVYSAFSNTVMLGTLTPTNTIEPSPTFDEFGIPHAPSNISAPQNLVSEYMTLNLRIKVPEDVKTLQNMNLYPVFTAVDWKMNNGEWHIGTNALTGSISIENILLSDHLYLDQNGYATIYLSRDSLKIPFGKSLATWLKDNTYTFRVRFVLAYFDENGVKYVYSPYSNTVTLGRGTAPPKPASKK